jgi:hypothetical protein
VCTRPISANGLGQRLADALENAEAIMDRSTVLEETQEVSRRLLSVIRAADCSGKQELAREAADGSFQRPASLFNGTSATLVIFGRLWEFLLHHCRVICP